jgi:hypothetical protein
VEDSIEESSELSAAREEGVRSSPLTPESFSEIGSRKLVIGDVVESASAATLARSGGTSSVLL